MLRGVWFVFLKDLKSDFKTKSSLYSIAFFIVVVGTVTALAASGQSLRPNLASGLIWTIMFFVSSVGLAKSFAGEAERGTDALLKTGATSTSIYFGKLIYVSALSFAANSLAVAVLTLFADIYGNISPVFLLAHILGTFGLAAASTIVSALVAKARSKSALFPALAFPILLPLIIYGSETTQAGLNGAALGETASNLIIMLSYCGIVVAGSYLLFDFVWED